MRIITDFLYSEFERVQTVTIALILRPTELPYIEFLRDVRRTFAILCTRDVPVDCEPCRRRSIEHALEGIYDEAANVREKLREEGIDEGS